MNRLVTLQLWIAVVQSNLSLSRTHWLRCDVKSKWITQSSYFCKVYYECTEVYLWSNNDKVVNRKNIYTDNLKVLTCKFFIIYLKYSTTGSLSSISRQQVGEANGYNFRRVIQLVSGVT